ncbi:hypothetical protein CHU98_g5785 [Xylaria longipes]|nr:hypothetical protein CHU98_g5785 [Xylaria longipes]
MLVWALAVAAAAVRERSDLDVAATNVGVALGGGGLSPEDGVSDKLQNGEVTGFGGTATTEEGEVEKEEKGREEEMREQRPRESANLTCWVEDAAGGGTARELVPTGQWWMIAWWARWGRDGNGGQ